MENFINEFLIYYKISLLINCEFISQGNEFATNTCLQRRRHLKQTLVQIHREQK